ERLLSGCGDERERERHDRPAGPRERPVDGHDQFPNVTRDASTDPSVRRKPSTSTPVPLRRLLQGPRLKFVCALVRAVRASSWNVRFGHDPCTELAEPSSRIDCGGTPLCEIVTVSPAIVSVPSRSADVVFGATE